MVFRKFTKGSSAVIVSATAAWWCSMVSVESWKRWNVDGGPWLSVDAQIASPVASRYFQTASTQTKSISFSYKN
jgi:hypothetical protein